MPPAPPDRPLLDDVVRALEVDGVYVHRSLRGKVGARQEVRIEDAVAAIPYPVKVAVLRSGFEGDAGDVLARLHQTALRDRTVDPAVYVGVDLAAGVLTAQEHDVTTAVGLAIPVAADRATGDVGRQLVVTTTLLADGGAERAYDRLIDEAGAPVAAAAFATPAAAPAPAWRGGPACGAAQPGRARGCARLRPVDPAARGVTQPSPRVAVRRAASSASMASSSSVPSSPLSSR